MDYHLDHSGSRSVTLRLRSILEGIGVNFRRLLRNAEPWYGFDKISISRLDDCERDFSDESEGLVSRVSLQWIGVHCSIQIGRTPPRIPPGEVRANKRRADAKRQANASPRVADRASVIAVLCEARDTIAADRDALVDTGGGWQCLDPRAVPVVADLGVQLARIDSVLGTPR